MSDLCVVQINIFKENIPFLVLRISVVDFLPKYSTSKHSLHKWHLVMDIVAWTIADRIAVCVSCIAMFPKYLFHHFHLGNLKLV